MRERHFLSVMRHEIDPVTGHNTFYVRAVERDEGGNKIGEGPLIPLGISGQAMDNEFGGHAEEHFEKFLISRKQAILDSYKRTCECAQHGSKLAGRNL